MCFPSRIEETVFCRVAKNLISQTRLEIRLPEREKDVSAKILAAASTLFSQKGYSNVSIRDVCRASGTTAPVIYYHFGSKKGLFDAVARREIQMTDFISKLKTATSVSSPKEGLKFFIKVYLSSFPEHVFDPGLYMRDSASLDIRSARIVSSDLERIRSIVSDLVESCIRKGEFRKTDPFLSSECLLGMLNRIIFQRIHFSKASDREAYGRFVTDFFFRALSLPSN
jgi:AcrR family transcriptional regulator